MPEASYALVLVADIIGSRALSPTGRSGAQDQIRTLAVTDGDRAAFRYTGGDEFEWALPDVPESLDRVLLLRARLAARVHPDSGVLLRCGLGRGRVTLKSNEGPYAEDGPAYHRARSAYDRVRRSAGRTRWSHLTPFHPPAPSNIWTAFEDGRPSALRDALLLHMDSFLQRWTPAQWQAVAAVLDGLRYEDAGRKMGISAQAVHQRVSAAQLDRFLAGHAALKESWAREVEP